MGGLLGGNLCQAPKAPTKQRDFHTKGLTDKQNAKHFHMFCFFLKRSLRRILGGEASVPAKPANCEAIS
jgi:hypothetical protein